MAKVERGSFTVTATGNKVILLNDDTITISKLAFSIATNNGAEVSTGSSDGTINFTGTSAYNEVSSTKSIFHYRNLSGTKTKTLEGVVTSLSTVGEFTINFSTLTESTQVKFVAYGS